VRQKVKATKEKGVEVRSLTCSTSGVRKVCSSSKMETKTNDKQVNYSYGLTQTIVYQYCLTSLVSLKRKGKKIHLLPTSLFS
jgi:hypothetical protein